MAGERRQTLLVTNTDPYRLREIQLAFDWLRFYMWWSRGLNGDIAVSRIGRFSNFKTLFSAPYLMFSG